MFLTMATKAPKWIHSKENRSLFASKHKTRRVSWIFLCYLTFIFTYVPNCWQTWGRLKSSQFSEFLSLPSK